jgi:hypothetical protein
MGSSITIEPSVLVTVEVPCPIPDCGSIVFAPNDCDNFRIDCLDCGAALLTRREIDGTVTLEKAKDAMVTDKPEMSPPPLGAGHHMAAFDANEPLDGQFPGPDATNSCEQTPDDTRLAAALRTFREVP